MTILRLMKGIPLELLSKWNKDHQNPRVVRVEDKGSGFVIDWKENYFRECSECISDESTFSKDDKDRSEENKEKVRQWATKWRKEEVISEEEENWIIVNQPKPARLYANIKTHKKIGHVGLFYLQGGQQQRN